MEYVNLNNNWLEQQIQETRKEVQDWPEWFREQRTISAERTDAQSSGAKTANQKTTQTKKSE